MTVRRSTRALTTILIGAVVGLTGCVDAADGTAPSAPSAPSDSVAPEPAPSSSPHAEADTLAPGIAPPDAPPAAEMPGGIDPSSDIALAWQALFSPVGEYAAAASYLAVLERFGTVEPYASILDGELRHIDALTRQLERAGVTVPDNPYLDVVVAPDDLEAAAQAWADGEVANVEMYDELIDQAGGSRLVTVLGNLRRASLESHLPAFEAAAAAGGTLDTMPVPAP